MNDNLARILVRPKKEGGGIIVRQQRNVLRLSSAEVPAFLDAVRAAYEKTENEKP